ncbi:hypothetical protein [Hugenholtzia roseola]|uniref:hypothetical protein n=1 Tax=Hugenholtzia roseola TaxID=1002 RepID=UPI00040AE29B|nr:hypothetical protein [Hugenholtzia roseola]
MKYANLREEELKIRVGQDYFAAYDCARIIGNIDFCVGLPRSPQLGLLPEDLPSFLWAEAKKGTSDLYKSITQLVLTIGKARTFDAFLPASFLGAFDAEKIAFIPYSHIQDVFYQNDFNWNVAPSNYETKEFKQIFEKVKEVIDKNALLFSFEKEDEELRHFIKHNFVIGENSFTKVQIDKNNFLVIYTKWLQTVKPTIAVNWDIAKKNGIIDGDFYLADLLSKENQTLKEKLYVVLQKDHYELARKLNEMGMFDLTRTFFADKQKAHTQFWNKYERPPQKEYWDYIVERRDLLVPQDVRERKGSFFTPQIWVETSQHYLAAAFGQDWQDEYFVWDCAAGTGNLLTGLTNKYHIWASTLDKQDVDVMHDRIKNGANLLEDQVFQFDFLNDDFKKLPEGLRDIIEDPEKRKKLIIYINPPYAEAAKYGKNKEGVSATKTYTQFKDTISFAVNELFSQFFARVYQEIPDAKLAAFSKLKYVTASNFSKFRTYFQAGYKAGFICRANSFDNVKGNFPIGFLIWDLSQKKEITKVKCDVFDNTGKTEGQKTFVAVKKGKVINDWLRQYYSNQQIIGYLRFVGPDFQANTGVFFTNQPKESDLKESRTTKITPNNVMKMSIYLAVRHCLPATWLNDRDQFLFPNKKWEKDELFQNDCLTFALFHGQNRISVKGGINYWIPFTESEVNARTKFKSNFMTDFIKGKLKIEGNGNLLESEKNRTTPLDFSVASQAVFAAGKALWQYYHAQPQADPNASFYDIKLHFQGKNLQGRMQSRSEDAIYTNLLSDLKEKLNLLAQNIEPKIYEYGFLKR